MWIGLWLSSLAFAGTCETETHVEQVGANVEDAMLAFATLDEDGFREAAASARAALPCVAEVFSPARAAAYHRMNGILAFLDSDAVNAQLAFAAALAIEPEFKLSTKVAPEGGRLARLYAAAAMEAPASSTYSVPRGYAAYTNGAPQAERIAAWPAIIQFEHDDSAAWTGYVAAGKELVVPSLAVPATAAVTAPPVEVAPPVLPPDVTADAGQQKPLMVDPVEPKAALPKAKPEPQSGGRGGRYAAAGAAIGTAGALFAVSAVTRSSFEQEPTHGKYSLVNGSYIGSVVVGVAAVGLTVHAVF